MKRLVFVWMALVVAVIACAKSTPATQMFKRLKKVQKHGIMFAHQDDPVYGTTWKWDKGRSDVRDVCGDYPAIMGFDLGKLELDSKENIDGVPFDRMRQEIIDQHRRGGFSTVSWHLWNPVTGGNSWDIEGRAVAAVLPGGAQHAKLNAWLDRMASFLLSLTDDRGRRVPVIFRPWHEMHGGWFWWGCKSCTPDEYKQLFRYTRQYLDQKGVDNALWCYSPGADPNESEERFMTWYPGDDCVELIGVDIYCNADTQGFIDRMKNELQVMASIAKKHKKLFAVAETGYRNTPQDDWFSEVLLPSLLDTPPLYVLLWRNAWDQPAHYFAPYEGSLDSENFKEFVASGRPKLLTEK